MADIIERVKKIIIEQLDVAAEDVVSTASFVDDQFHLIQGIGSQISST